MIELTASATNISTRVKACLDAVIGTIVDLFDLLDKAVWYN